MRLCRSVGAELWNRLKDSVLSSPSSPISSPDRPVRVPELTDGKPGKVVDTAELAKRELQAARLLAAAEPGQEKLFRLLLLPLLPEHVDLVAVEDRPVVGAPRDGCGQSLAQCELEAGL